MDKFDPNDAKFSSSIKEIQIETVIADVENSVERYKQSKVEYLNNIFSTSYNYLKCFKGVYVFVVDKDDGNLFLDENFFKETYLYKKNIDNQFEYVRTVSSSFKSDPPRKPGDGVVELVHGNVFYCGRSDNIFSRTKEHLSSNTYTGNMSLKLGFDSRKWVREYLKCYIILIDDEDNRAEIEDYIQNSYGSYFGNY